MSRFGRTLFLDKFARALLPRMVRSISSSRILEVSNLDYYDTTVQRYAEMSVDRMTMTRIMSAGTNVNPEKLVVMAQHVQKELSIRLARRLLDMQTLPYVVVANPHIQQVYQMYDRAFSRLVSFPKVTNTRIEAEFVELVKALVQEAVQVVQLLARGMHEARRKIRQTDQSTGLNANQFLADMFMSRISRRVIAEQYIALHREQPGFVGIISTQLSPVEVLRRVIPEAALQCQQTYGTVPEASPSLPCLCAGRFREGLGQALQKLFRRPLLSTASEVPIVHGASRKGASQAVSPLPGRDAPCAARG